MASDTNYKVQKTDRSHEVSRLVSMPDRKKKRKKQAPEAEQRRTAAPAGNGQDADATEPESDQEHSVDHYA